MSGQTVSVCRANAEGKKTFLAKRFRPLVSVTFKPWLDGPCACAAWC